jgi:class 3 adenylate cyclase/TolB-like protein
MERRLAAILAADAVGYSRFMARDEEAALAALSERRSVIDALVAAHSGVVFGSAGDSVIAEFPSSVEAARCAVEIQERLKALNDGLPEDQRMLFRIGVSFGDIMEEDGDFFGDGVNLAARLESLAPPGGICLSAQVAEQLSGPLAAAFAKAGRHRLKNLPKAVAVWCWPARSAGPLRRKAATAKRAQLLAATLVAAMAAAAVVLYLEETPDDAVPSGPRIAVLPFTNIGGNTEDAYFSVGLTNDINALLSKFSNLFVIAPQSVRVIGEKATCAEVRRELGADYILDGTVRRSQDQLRVTTSFTDAKTCLQLDSPGPFDQDLTADNVLDLQLEIAKKVVAEVGSADAPLFNAEVQNAIRRKAPESLEAYECVLLSYWFYETFEAERHRRARSCLEHAVKIDPDYSLAWSRLAFSYIESKKYAINTPPDWAARAQAAAERALEIDPDNPDAYYALAILSQMTGEERSVFRNFAEKAIALNPNDAFVLADLGTWMGYSGAWELGKEWVSRAKLINPKHQSWVDYIWSLEAYLGGDYETARDVAEKMNLPGNYMVQASLTATYAMNGEREKAEQALAHLLEIRPDYPKDPRAPFRSRGMPEELIEGLMEGLRKAGLDVPPQ